MSLLVDKETQNKRLAICRACVHRVENKIPFSNQKIEFCGKCGCPLGNKTRIARATCPIHKW